MWRGRTRTLRSPDPETATLAYDAAKRPTALNFTIAGSGAIGQTYDRAGNVASESRNLANAGAISGDSQTGTLTYTYDGLNRLTGSSGAGGSRSYRYDLEGNRPRSETVYTLGHRPRTSDGGLPSLTLEHATICPSRAASSAG